MQILSSIVAILLGAALAPTFGQSQPPGPAAGSSPTNGGGNETPPVIVTPPKDQDAAPDTTVTFAVTVTGNPAPHFQWRRNGIVLTNETNRILTLLKVQPSTSGAYSVTVWNHAGVVTSPVAHLRVRGGEQTVPADQFKNRTTYRLPYATLQGSSATATVEAGELVPVGGGKTVWFEWIAPYNGIATFETRGSSFDTILSVFAGANPTQGSLVTQDDDGGGYYSSRVEFNARKGEVFQIQLAGFDYAGTGGPFTLTWGLEDTSQVVPVLRIVPQPQGVLKGATATFRALSRVSTDLYQWYLNNTPLRGATNSLLIITNASKENVGLYHVVVRNKSRSITSRRVGLQLTLSPGILKFENQLALIQDKYQYILYSSANGNRPGAGWISIGLGDTVGKLAYSEADAQQGDPTPCNAPLFGTVFQGLHAEDNGMVYVDTTGSATQARMAVYLGAVGLGELLLACDLTNGPAGLPCLIKFPATLNSNYTVVVESYEAAGNLNLTCKMGMAPPPLSNPLVCAIPLDGSISLTAPGMNWNPLPTRRWLFNNAPMPGETGATLLVSAFNASKVGLYSVVLSNFVSVVTNPVANLTLAGPFLLGQQWSLQSDKPRFVLRASNAAPFVIETTTNLNSSWVPIATNVDPCFLLRLTNANPLVDAQRFFRAVPWP